MFKLLKSLFGKCKPKAQSSTNAKLQQVRDRLLSCERPIFLFDDDPDGLASFLLLYRLVHTGKGMPLKGSKLNERMADHVNNYQPDLVIVLDKAEVAQEFFDAVKADCIWIDHHEPQHPHNVLYVNPRTEQRQNNIPTSRLAYEIAKQDEWIAVTGIVADWQLPDEELYALFSKKYATLLPSSIKTAPDALYTTKIGELARIFSFNLKGKNSDVLTAMKILTRINEPQELLDKQHAQAKLVMKRYDKLLQEYTSVKQNVVVKPEDSILLYTYSDDTNSFTTDLSNELLYLYPSKIIIIARESNGSYKCSLRASQFNLEETLQEVLQITGGQGGGHEHACGAVIPKDAFAEFVDVLREKSDKKLKK